MKKVTVKQNEENPEPVELIAESIIKIADGFDKMKKSRLTERAIYLLIQDSVSSSIGMNTIREVLNAAADLKKSYIKDLPKK